MFSPLLKRREADLAVSGELLTFVVIIIIFLSLESLEAVRFSGFFCGRWAVERLPCLRLSRA